MYHIVHAPNDNKGRTLRYEETDLNDNPQASSKLMIRITLAKVMDQQRLEELIRSIKIPQSPTRSWSPCSPSPSNTTSQTSSSDEEEEEEPHASSSYTCLTFVREAFALLTSPTTTNKPNRPPLKSYFSDKDWKDIEWRTRKYIKKKRAQGRFRPDGVRNYLLGGPATWNPDEVATWNFWENRETTD